MIHQFMNLAGFMGYLYGDRVIESEHCVIPTQIRFPRTKRRRIQKKWRKNHKNFIDKPGMLKTPFGIVCHPSILRKLKVQV